MDASSQWKTAGSAWSRGSPSWPRARSPSIRIRSRPARGPTPPTASRSGPLAIREHVSFSPTSGSTSTTTSGSWCTSWWSSTRDPSRKRSTSSRTRRAAHWRSPRLPRNLAHRLTRPTKRTELAASLDGRAEPGNDPPVAMAEQPGDDAARDSCRPRDCAEAPAQPESEAIRHLASLLQRPHLALVLPAGHGQELGALQEATARVALHETEVVVIDWDHPEQEDPAPPQPLPQGDIVDAHPPHGSRHGHPKPWAELVVDGVRAHRSAPHLIGGRCDTR